MIASQIDPPDTSNIDPPDARRLSIDDAQFMCLVNSVLGDRRCRDCGGEIVERGPRAIHCVGCIKDHEAASQMAYLESRST